MSRSLIYLARNRPRIRPWSPILRTSLRRHAWFRHERPAWLMERRDDRELPMPPSPWDPWAKTLPIFIVVMVATSLGIFNYQKSTSSVVTSTMYALRTSPRARELLGTEIYFRDQYPWIWGTMNSWHGNIDIGFGVKGTKAKGFMRFKSQRKTRKDYFHTLEWSLELEDGQITQLLQKGNDPLAGSHLASEPTTTAA